MSSGKNPFADFMADFFAECDEHLVIVRRDIVGIEAYLKKPRVDPALTDELFRSFHTLKGLCGMVDLKPGEELAHQMESYLRALKDNKTRLSRDAVDTLVGGVQRFENAINARREGKEPPAIDEILNDFKRLTPASPKTSAPEPTIAVSDAAISLKAEESAQLADALNRGGKAWRIEFLPTPALSKRGVNVNVIRERLKTAGEIISAQPRVNASGALSFEFLIVGEPAPATLSSWKEDGVVATPYEEIIAPLDDQEKIPSGRLLQSSNVVRVDLAKLDDLMRVVGELVVTRSRLSAASEPLEPLLPAQAWRRLDDATQALERQIKNLRERVMRVRMVAVGDVFGRMQFVVRDLVKGGDKGVRLNLSGQETEIDKFVVERIMDPLLHLVRNAVSHGFESKNERAALGKPPEGTLSLRASTAGDIVVIEVEDDGRGVDADYVVGRAKKMGLPTPAVVDSAPLLDILCSPGFSTRDEADRVSGRGIGMAVVKNTVQQLGGRLAMKTAAGQGTTFTISLPLTLSIVDALLVTVGDRTLAVPLPAVREISEVQPASISTLENNEIISYRGGVLRLLRLSKLFRVAENKHRMQYALVINTDGEPAGLVVDRLIGQREVVVHALEDALSQAPGVAGATQLGDGRVILILDGPVLAKFLMSTQMEELCPRA